MNALTGIFGFNPKWSDCVVSARNNNVIIML